MNDDIAPSGGIVVPDPHGQKPRALLRSAVAYEIFKEARRRGFDLTTMPKIAPIDHARIRDIAFPPPSRSWTALTIARAARTAAKEAFADA